MGPTEHWSLFPPEPKAQNPGSGLFGFAFLVLAMVFERDKQNNPAERSTANARLTVAHVVQWAKMNWSPAI
jgi:hypothetical protein